MSRIKGLVVGAVMVMVGFLAASAQAGTVYIVNAGASSLTVHNAGDGLLLGAAVVVADGYSFDLSGVGDSATFTFAKVWTPETWVNLGEDTQPKAISATLAFTAPASAGTVTGESVGVSQDIFGIEGFYQAGKITWGGPTYVDAPTGQYKITLNDVTFGEGAFWTGLNPHDKAWICATVEQMSITTGDPGNGDPQIIVPLPTAIWSGLVLMGVVVGRRMIRKSRTA